jgi:hypothetical protein
MFPARTVEDLFATEMLSTDRRSFFNLLAGHNLTREVSLDNVLQAKERSFRKTSTRTRFTIRINESVVPRDKNRDANVYSYPCQMLQY